MERKKKKIYVKNNTCVDNCSMLFNSFEYESKCYENCPNGSYKYIYFDSNDNYYLNCSNEGDLQGFYLDEDDSFYKMCYPSCKKCNKEGNEIRHNCLECKENYPYQFNNLNSTNCYSNCSNYHYYNNITKNFYCTNTSECPSNYNKLISYKKECIDNCQNDIKYKYEFNNECFIECPNGTINDSFHCINIDSKDLYDIIKNKIMNNFKNNFNLTLKEERIIPEIHYYEMLIDKILVKFSSTNSSRINKNKNMTAIDLGKCEDVIKNFYNI